MLRITIQKTTDAVDLKLEGSVRGPWVDELRQAWRSGASKVGKEPLNVDLGPVSFIDARGRNLLLRMRKEGAVLKGASSFLRHMLEDGKGNFGKSGKGREAK